MDWLYSICNYNAGIGPGSFSSKIARGKNQGSTDLERSLDFAGSDIQLWHFHFYGQGKSHRISYGLCNIKFVKHR